VYSRGLVASERARNTIVTAGAGSDKTRTLVAQYLGLLSEGFQPRQVVAVTFTEKAAREMRSRTRTLLYQVLHQAGSPAEQQRWVGFDAQMDSVRIGTIHKIVPLDMCHPGGIIYNYDIIST
jgi:ATP-dependent exoDNAse (exonuclease V) beta subunit